MLWSLIVMVLPGSLVVELDIARQSSDVVLLLRWGLECPGSLTRGPNSLALGVSGISLEESSAAILGVYHVGVTGGWVFFSGKLYKLIGSNFAVIFVKAIAVLLNLVEIDLVVNFIIAWGRSKSHDGVNGSFLWTRNEAAQGFGNYSKILGLSLLSRKKSNNSS